MKNKCNVRKGCSPEQTIEKIQSILAKIGIKLKTSIIENEQFVYSCRVTMENLGDRVGTNGKGLTEELSLASAYAEFMERLQSGQLLKNFYTKKKDIFYGYDVSVQNLNEYVSQNEHVINPIFQENYKFIGPDFFNHFADRGSGNASFLPFYNFSRGQLESLPITFVNKICSSTGLCAGNSQEEAITQGVCEILERAVHKKIYKENLVLPTIDLEEIKSYPSFGLVKYLIDNKYEVLVKDCTINGKYPVVGVLLIDPTRTRYTFRLGSDPDIDIAIQRSITEMFQGIRFNKYFSSKSMLIIDYESRLYLNNRRSLIEEGAFESYSNYLNSIKNNLGQYPLSIFYNTKSNGEYKSAFMNGTFNNKEALKHLFGILAEDKKEVYIRDYSYLGFPTYRVFVPGISESNTEKYIYSYIHSKENNRPINIDVTKFLSHATRMVDVNGMLGVVSQKLEENTAKTTKDDVIKSVIEHWQECLAGNSNIILENYMPVLKNRLNTIAMSDRVIIALYNLENKNYTAAYDAIKEFVINMDISCKEDFRFFYALMLYAKQKSYGVKQPHILNFLDSILGSEFSKKFTDKIDSSSTAELITLPNCPNCISCGLSDDCCYTDWERIEHKLIELETHRGINQKDMELTAINL